MARDGEDERRDSPRIRMRRNVTVTLRGVDHETHTINISLGGASVELVAPPDQGARGSIVIELTEGEPINLIAEVRWVTSLSTQSPAGIDSRYLVGLHFVSVPKTDGERLGAAIDAEDEDDMDDK